MSSKSRRCPRYLWPDSHQRDLPSWQAEPRKLAEAQIDKDRANGAPNDLFGYLRWSAGQTRSAGG